MDGVWLHQVCREVTVIAIQLKGTVQRDGTLVVKLPATVSPGVHEIVVVLPSDAQQEETGELATSEIGELDLAAYPVGLVDDTFTFRRETLYGDQP